MTPIKFLCSIAFCLFLLCGCSEQDVQRAEVAVTSAHEMLARAEAAEKRAAEGVEAARVAAAALGNEKAAAIVKQAEDALALVRASTDIVRATSNGADSALASAKAAQAAGGSTIDVLLGILGVAVPGAGGVVLAVQKARAASTALRQTVAGINDARRTMPVDVWNDHVAPALNTHQDHAVRKKIDAIQRANALAAVKADV